MPESGPFDQGGRAPEKDKCITCPQLDRTRCSTPKSTLKSNLKELLGFLTHVHTENKLLQLQTIKAQNFTSVSFVAHSFVVQVRTKLGFVKFSESPNIGYKEPRAAKLQLQAHNQQRFLLDNN